MHAHMTSACLTGWVPNGSGGAHALLLSNAPGLILPGSLSGSPLGPWIVRDGAWGQGGVETRAVAWQGFDVRRSLPFGTRACAFLLTSPIFMPSVVKKAAHSQGSGAGALRLAQNS